VNITGDHAPHYVLRAMTIKLVLPVYLLLPLTAVPMVVSVRDQIPQAISASFMMALVLMTIVLAVLTWIVFVLIVTLIMLLTLVVSVTTLPFQDLQASLAIRCAQPIQMIARRPFVTVQLLVIVLLDVQEGPVPILRPLVSVSVQLDGPQKTVHSGRVIVIQTVLVPAEDLLPMIVFPARVALLQLRMLPVCVAPVISELNAANMEEHAQ